jgi:hypothetical protein
MERAYLYSSIASGTDWQRGGSTGMIVTGQRVATAATGQNGFKVGCGVNFR